MTGRLGLALAIALVGVACGGADDATAPAPTPPAPTPPATATVPLAPPPSSSPTSAPTSSPTSPTSASTEPAPEAVVHDPADVPVPEGAIVPEGFPRFQAMVTTADGRICELCVWLAEGELRSRGLSSVDDIGPADGMAFVYPEPDTRTFNMEYVRIDLDIAFFDDTGAFMDAFAMEACPLGGCRRYPTPENISTALEVRSGSLPTLGIGPGSTLEISDLPCT